MDDSVRVGVDVGGTFTDVVLVGPAGLTTAKVPTTTPQHEGVIEGVRTACDRSVVDPADVDRFRHAMTVATNALLETDGAETALVTTEGFADVVAIGRQNRPNLYDQSVARADPLVPAARRYELDERATPEGIETAVDPDAVRDLADDIDAEAVAVSLLHAYAHPENERRVAEILREELDAPVSASHEVLGAFREYERTATTTADAFVTPVLATYLGALVEEAEDLGLPEPRVMQSNGGIAEVGTVRENAVTTALSGPAAGVVGASAFEPDDAAGLVTFDMGGTSSDVSLVRDGDIQRTTDADVGDRPVRVPMVDIEPVGAGAERGHPGQQDHGRDRLQGALHPHQGAQGESGEEKHQNVAGQPKPSPPRAPVPPPLHPLTRPPLTPPKPLTPTLTPLPYPPLPPPPPPFPLSVRFSTLSPRR
jgi:N-methylhydantoinase A